LIELNAILTGDAAQGNRRNVAREDDDGNPAMERFPYLRGDEKAVHAIRQIVVCENEVGLETAMSEQFKRCGAVGCRGRAMALVREDHLEQFTDFSVVLDDQDRADTVSATTLLTISREDSLAIILPAIRGERDRDGKDRALAGLRADMHRMAKQGRQTLHDGETEPEAETALPRGIAELMIFAEDCLKILFRNADAGIPNLDAQLPPLSTAAKQHLSPLCIFQRVRQEIAKHLLEKTRIAMDRKAAPDHAQKKLLRPGMVGEFIPQPLEQVIDRKIGELGVYRPGFELVDVEQRVEHARHGGGGFVEAPDQGQGFILVVVPNLPGQNAVHQA